MRFIREHLTLVKQAIRNRGLDITVDELLALDQQRRDLRRTIEALHHERNELSRHNQPRSPSSELIERGRQIKHELTHHETACAALEERYTYLLEMIPNIPTDDTPVGSGEEHNVIVRTVGETPTFTFTPQEHWQLGIHLDVIDNERAAKVSGSRFTYLKGELALLELALIQYAFNILTDQKMLERIIEAAHLAVVSTPFIPVIPPALVRSEVLRRMARLEPREERYHLPSDNLYLVGSAEHTLGPLHMDEVLSEDAMPLRYVGFSPSFRREAGSYGKDVRGILRMHQFDKIEMESFALPEQGLAEQDFLVAVQEHLVQSLGLPYRVVTVCTGEMGLPDARQIDLEIWLPGQHRYRETHSADYVTDYQSRRLRTKIKRADDSSVFAYMNDATAFAIGRTIIAIMENYQQADGSIALPHVLHSYLPFTTIQKTATVGQL